MSDGPRPWRPPSRSAGSGLSPQARTGLAGGAGRVIEFKRKSGVPVRRKSRVVALVGHFFAALVLVGLPAAGLLWLVTSPRFAVSELEIEVPGRVGAGWVEARLAPLVGANLLWLPLERIERRLLDHPWVAGVEATKLPPDRLRVVVVERRPAALLVDRQPAGFEDADEAGERLVWIDHEGREIAPVGPETSEVERREALRLAWAAAPPAEEPERQEALQAALGVAASLGAARPTWGGGIERIVILGREDFRIESRTLGVPLLVGPGSFGRQLEILDRLAPELEARYPHLEAVDLRFSHRIVVRPATEGAGSERGAWRGEPYGKT